MNSVISENGIFYEDRGEGSPLPLLHGLGATHRVVAPDARGADRSAELLGWTDLLHRQATRPEEKV